MAVQISRNPWTIAAADVPTAVLPAANILGTAGTNVKVLQFEWTFYTAATDKCIITDDAGNIIWECDGKADLDPIRSGNIGWVRGVKVTRLDSGIVNVHVR